MKVEVMLLMILFINGFTSIEGYYNVPPTTGNNINIIYIIIIIYHGRYQTQQDSLNIYIHMQWLILL